MDSITRPGSKKRMKRRTTRLAGTLMLLLLAVGCAASKPAPDPVVELPPVAEQRTVTRLDGGRSGFVITEPLDSPVPWNNEFDRAVTLLKGEKDAEAIPLLEEIVRQSPVVTAPYINLAMAYRHTQQYDRAEEQLQSALQLVPRHPVANNEYGLLLREAGRFEESREIYEATLLAFPDYLPIRLNLGILCEIYLGDMACALEQYTLFSEGNPNDQAMQVWIADLKLRMGLDQGYR